MLTNRALAPTTFIAGPEDDLAAPDVYEITSDDPINKLPIPASIADVSDITGELRGGKSLLSSLPGLDSIQSAATAGMGGLTSQLKSGSSSMLDSVKQVGSTALKAVGGVGGVTALIKGGAPSLLSRIGSGSISGIPGLNNGSLTSLASTLANSAMPASVKQLFNAPIASSLGSFSTVGNVVTKLLPGNINQSYQMSSLINSVTGTGSVGMVDKDATTRLITGLALGGMSSGMNNSFSSLLPLAGGDKSIEMAAGMAVYKYAGNTGNIGGMKDVVTSVDPMNLSPATSGVMKGLFSNYQPSEQAPQSTTSRLTDYSDLRDVANLVDPGWMREDRIKVDPVTQVPVPDFPVTNISMVVEGTADARNMMVTGAIHSDDPEEKWMCAAGMFPASSPEAELKKNFPYTTTVISSNTTTNNTFTPEQIKAMDNIMVE
jgi:hypothetical protein